MEASGLDVKLTNLDSQTNWLVHYFDIMLAFFFKFPKNPLLLDAFFQLEIPLICARSWHSSASDSLPCWECLALMKQKQNLTSLAMCLVEIYPGLCTFAFSFW